VLSQDRAAVVLSSIVLPIGIGRVASKHLAHGLPLSQPLARRFDRFFHLGRIVSGVGSLLAFCVGPESAMTRDMAQGYRQFRPGKHSLQSGGPQLPGIETW